MKKILIIFILLGVFFTYGQKKTSDDDYYYYYNNNTFLYAVDLNGTDEYMSNSSPVNMDLNDTNRVVNANGLTSTINSDFELADIITNGDFTSDLAGWIVSGGDRIYYTSDYNSIGRVNLLLDSATTTFSYIKKTISLTEGNIYQLSYKYYIPSANTSVSGIQPRFIATGNPFLTEQTTLDAWTTVTETFIAAPSVSKLYFYMTDGAGGFAITSGDLLYIDDVSIVRYPDWAGTGNHGFDTTSTSPLKDSYSGIVINTAYAVSADTIKIIADGNSLTVGAGREPYPAQLQNILGDAYAVDNNGVGAVTSTNRLANQGTVLAKWHAAGDINILWIGGNDFSDTTVTADSVYKNIKNYGIASQDTGFIFIVATVTPRSGSLPANFETRRLALNDSIRTNWNTFADYLVDLAIDSRLTDPTNTTYFTTDQVHLTTEGYSVVTELIYRYFGYTSLPSSNYTTLESGKNYTFEMQINDVGVIGDDLLEGNAGAFNDSIYSWVAYGTNLIDTTVYDSRTKVVEITYVDNALGGFFPLRYTKDLRTDLTVGSSYQLNYVVAVNGGSVDIVTPSGTSTITSTTFVAVTDTFVAISATSQTIRFANMGAGEIVYFDSLRIYEITPVSIAVAIGDSSWTWANLNPSTTQTLIKNFTASASTTGDIKISIDRPDTIKIDGVDLSESFNATISTWIKSSNTGNAQEIVNYTASSVGFNLANASTDKLTANIGDGTNTTITGSGDVIDGNWQLVSVTFDRLGNGQLYINGVADGSAVDISGVGIVRNSATFYIGENTDNFNGQVGETKYDRGTNADLTAAQILTNFNNGHAGKNMVETGNEVGWWLMKDATDETGDNNMIINGTVTFGKTNYNN